jgi:hypothetical protein
MPLEGGRERAELARLGQIYPLSVLGLGASADLLIGPLNKVREVKVHDDYGDVVVASPP